MSKKIAILLGVSNYEKEENLPPCENDLILMSHIVKQSESFDEILVVGNSPKSSLAKDKISTFIRSFQGQEVSEVLFYYTGHGTRHDDDFLYLFSDFDWSKKEQTSLRNTELDSLLKSLSPGLAVKVVDACKAGTEYIKSDGDLESIFRKSTDESFEKTYFLFSSSKTESSVALLDYSVFTKSYAMSLLNFHNKEIRYRDIMAFISDDQNVKKHQTPLFIQQASNTEVFCSVNDDLKLFIENKVGQVDEATKVSESLNNQSNELASSDSAKISLVSTVKNVSENYCSEEEAAKSLASFIQLIENFSWSNTLKDLYNINLERLDNYWTVTGVKSIAKWLSESKEPYFCEVTYSTEDYQAKEKVEIEEGGNDIFSMPSIFGRGNKRYEYRPVTRQRKVVSGINVTAPSPCACISIKFEPKEEALEWINIFIVFIFSKSKLTVFSKYEFDKESSWTERRTLCKNEWSIMHSPLKNENKIREFAKAICETQEGEILKRLEEIFSKE